MTEQEVHLLKEKVRQYYRWEKLHLSHHAKERMRKRRIYKKQIRKTLENYNVIEYHEKDFEKRGKHFTDKRVVVRSKNFFGHKHRQVVVVYSLTRNVVITVWDCDINDKHETLDMTIYNEDMQINL